MPTYSPQMQDVLTLLRAVRDGTPAPTGTRGEVLAVLRERADQVAALFPAPADVAVTSTEVGGVPADVLTVPESRADRVLLYLHGGAYVAYSPRTHRELAARIGRRAGCTVVVPGYRLAPEHPYPAAVDDALACFRSLAERGPVVVAGDSAGGGLALALWQRIRAAGLVHPPALALISPWTDLTLSGASITDVPDDLTLDAGRLRGAARDYAGDHLAGPEVSPLFADLSGLPPTAVEVGTGEILLDDSVRLADAVGRTGGIIELRLGPCLPHVFPMFGVTPEAVAATDRLGAFLATYL